MQGKAPDVIRLTERISLRELKRIMFLHLNSFFLTNISFFSEVLINQRTFINSATHL